MTEVDELEMLRDQNEGFRALTAEIHAVLDEYDGDEAVKRIREVLYGTPEKTDE